VRRFLEEAQIEGQLEHPGVVPVYEVGLAGDGRPYFTMRLVGDRTLASLLAQASAGDRWRLLAVFGQLCDTVAYAHARGVVHGDLTPRNVLVGAFGEVQLVDWGSAGLSEAEGRATAGGTGGEASEADESSDVLALGVILLELLTGEAGLEGTEERLRTASPDPELARLCRSCLSEDRPRDAGVLAAAVRHHLAATEERRLSSEVRAVEERAAADLARARAEEARERARETRRRRRQLWGITGAALLALLTAAGVWFSVEGGRRRRADRRREEVEVGLAEADRLAGAGRWDRALEAAERAFALASSPDPDEELAGAARAALARVREEAAAARRAEVRAAEDAKALQRLAEIVLRGEDPASCREVLRGLGADPETLPPADSAAVLAARTRPAELAEALDRVWLRGGPDAERLRAVAGLLDPEPERRRIRDAAGRGDLAELERVRRDLAVREAPAHTLELLASALAARGEQEASANLLREAWLRHPGSFWIHAGLGRLLLELDPPAVEEASFHLEAARSLRPDSAGVRLSLGRARLRADRRLSALRSFRRAAGLAPEWAEAHESLAKACRLLGDLEGAAAAAGAALALDPGREDAARVLDEVSATLEDPVAAANELDRFGRCLQDADEIGEAVKAFEAAVRLDPGRATHHTCLGFALGARQDFPAAVASFRRAEELAPEDPGTLLGLGQALFETGDLPGALAVLEKAVALAPGDLRTLVGLGQAQWRAGLHEAAARTLRQVLELDPQSVVAHGLLGLLLSEPSAVRDIDGALAHARRAAKLRPDWDGSRSLGTVLFRAGRYDEALRAYGRALLLASTLTHENLLMACIAYAKLGHSERARSLLDSCEIYHSSATSTTEEAQRLMAEARELIEGRDKREDK
jgi:serine/threonine-protein kinase